MPFTLAYRDADADDSRDAVPGIPDQASPVRFGRPRTPDRQEHFGTEALALRRANDLLPAPDWLELRLYGPDGSRIATQHELTRRFGLSGPEAADASQEPFP